MKNIVFIIILFLVLYSVSCQSATKGKKQTELLKVGEPITIYETSYLNDHAIIYNSQEKKWHLYGIQEPQTSFIHLTADSLLQNPWMKQADFTDEGKEIWAPHIIFHNGLFYMFYSAIGVPREIRLAVSKDLYNWEKSENNPILALKNEYTGNMKNKDPMVFYDDLHERWIMYFSMMKDDKHWVVGYSTSSNLVNWSEPGICFDEQTEEPNVESPFVLKRNNKYYFFLSARPWPYGGVDGFASDTPYSWKVENQVSRFFPWHASEIVKDLNGKWYITFAAVSKSPNFKIAPLYWNENSK